MQVDFLIGMIKIEEILLNTKKFKIFLKSKNIKNSKPLFNGYLFLLKCVERKILDLVADSYYLDLNDSPIWNQAKWQGVSIEKIPADCKLATITKNMYLEYKKTWASEHANDFRVLEKKCSYAIKVNKILNQILNKHFDKDSEITKISKKDLIEYYAKLTAEIFLIDTSSMGYPKAYSNVILNHKLYPQFLKSAFKGYKFGLGYLWGILLQNNENEVVKKILESKNFNLLDRNFTLVQNKIINPIEIKHEINSILTDNFKKTSKIKISEFKHLNNYLKKPNLSEKENLEQTCLWYPISSLYPEKIFNGVQAFTMLLLGVINFYPPTSKPKIKIIRFKHPEPPGHRYSYAILLESHGTFSDYSGWILFYSCATDFSGFGGGEHARAEGTIKKYKKYLNISELIINEEKLLDSLNIMPEKAYLKMGVSDSKSLLKKINELEEIEKADTGNILELLTMFCLSSNDFKIKQWSEEKRKNKKDEYQIDIIAEKQGQQYLIECTNVIPTQKNKYNDFIKEIKTKNKKLGNKMKCKVITSFCPPHIKEEFETENINVSNISELINGSSVGRQKKIEILLRLKKNKKRTLNKFFKVMG